MHTVFWLENLKGKRPLGRSRCRWEHNIRMDLREIGWDSVNWMHVAQDRDQWRALVNTVSIRCGEFLVQLNECKLLKNDTTPCS
jgi:hypothetical protein